MWARAILHGFQLCECACGVLRILCRVGHLLRVWRGVLLVGLGDVMLAVSCWYLFDIWGVVMHILRRGYFHHRRRIYFVCGLSDHVVSVGVRVELQCDGIAELPAVSRRPVLCGVEMRDMRSRFLLFAGR